MTNRGLLRGFMAFACALPVVVGLSVLGNRSEVESAAPPDIARIVPGVMSHQAVVRQPASAVEQPAADLFQTHCAACHGSTGQGDGAAAWIVYPKPRDFTRGVFRFKSTPDAQRPTREDLVRTISGGIARTAMPGFSGVLNALQIESLADYVAALAPMPEGEGAEAVTPITIPRKPEFTRHLIEDGQRVYKAMGCGPCHGETGQGDGGSSWTLRDNDGWPLPPADFTTGVYKAGARAEDLYRTIMVGVPGTPMPNFRGAIEAGVKVEGIDPKTDMVWALTAYLQSLATERKVEAVSAGALFPTPVAPDTAMLTDPLHSAWRAAVPTRISVSPLWQRKHFAHFVEIRAVRSGDRIAIRMSWPDDTANTASGGVDLFSDACGLMFSLTDEVPPLAMGALLPQEDPNHPKYLVNLWQWRGDRQLNADRTAIQDAPSQTSNPSDVYMFKKGNPVLGPLTESDPIFIAAWHAGNPKSDPALLTTPTLEANAVGIGSLTWQNPESQGVNSIGQFADGWWHVVMTRSIKASEPLDVVFNGSGRIPVAFAVWDGAAGDRNGTKLISGWHFLTTAGDY